MTLAQLCETVDRQCSIAKRNAAPPILSIHIIHQALIDYQKSLQIPPTRLG